MLVFKLCSMSLISKLAYCREVSSANKSQIALLTESGRSFIYKENNKGLRIGPCGIPLPVSLFEEITPFKLSDWVRLDKYDLKKKKRNSRLTETVQF